MQDHEAIIVFRLSAHKKNTDPALLTQTAYRNYGVNKEQGFKWGLQCAGMSPRTRVQCLYLLKVKSLTLHMLLVLFSIYSDILSAR